MLSRDLERFARAIWPAAAGLLLGLAIGGVWTLLQPDRYRAETHLILKGAHATSLGPAVETIANGSVVQENVRQTLRLSHPPDLSASLDKGILGIVARAGSRERTRQVDAEAAVVVTQVVASRFRSQGVQASLLDPAHVTDQTSPTLVRNLLLCGLLGLLAGGALAYPRLRSRPRSAPPLGVLAVEADVERRLKKRVGEVTKRERALARRAGELAKREGDLGKRETEHEQRRGEIAQLETRLKDRAAELDASDKQLVARASEIAAGERELQARAEAPPPPPPRPAPTPEPEPVADEVPPAEAQPRIGSWNINDLQHAVDAQTGATADQVDEWTTYLFFLREHTASDGSLPRQFDGLIADVFGPLVG